MRIIAIGLGGAGCRIVDSLYSIDRRSSKVACIQGLAVDVDEDTIKQLTALPESSRIHFPAMDPEVSNRERGVEPTATIDIAEIVSRLHNFESGETDAILICLGLGGSMTDIAPHVITALRSTIVEPIFGLVTLPCLAEGEKRSGKAADDIDILSPLLDGMILFDNETWYKKTKALKATLVKKERGLAHRLGLAKPEPELSPELATYQLLNEGIVRRISLILRAGEFRADGGIDLAEVVLDSGEVLNTMKGMGFITIGYAVERLPSNPLAFLSQFRSQGVFDEENKKKASRIVDLAKQAIYHEISTPCDMTSAHKALVLIAGPSHELSMKGFMTVRKWIDRSIAGLETRSGDYPILNTKNVAIIVMLSGLENIPRISELREIRTQYSSWAQKRAGRSSGDESADGRALPPDHGTIRDEMIVLPVKMRKVDETTRRSPEISKSRHQDPIVAEPVHTRYKPDHPVSNPVHAREHPATESKATEEAPKTTSSDEIITQTPATHPKPPSQRRIVSSEGNTHKHPSAHIHSHTPHTRETETLPSTKLPIRETGTHQEPGMPHAGNAASGTKDAARQRIELELQKQRLKAMSGRIRQSTEDLPQEPTIPHEPVRKKPEIRAKPLVHETTPHAKNIEKTPEPEQRTVIVAKRKLVSRPMDTPIADAGDDSRAPTEEAPRSRPVYESDQRHVDTTVAIKEPGVRAKDRVFEGREVQKPKILVTKDASLLHTNIKQKKQPDASQKERVDPDKNTVSPEPDKEETKPEKKGKKPEDISWI
jgi:cell division GTPase FtsZ